MDERQLGGMEEAPGAGGDETGALQRTGGGCGGRGWGGEGNTQGCPAVVATTISWRTMRQQGAAGKWWWSGARRADTAGSRSGGSDSDRAAA